MLLFLWGFQPGLPGQEPAAFLWSPTNAIRANEPLSLSLHLLNTSPDGITVRFPAALQVVFRSGDRRVPCRLEPAQPENLGPLVIKPGEFARREYAATAPCLTPGPVVVESTNVAMNQLRLQVLEPAGTNPPASFAAAEKAAKETTPRSRSDAMAFFKKHFYGYEPFYFIVGPDSPNAKFQFSFKYRLIDSCEESGWRNQISHTYAAYTQTSLWDLSKPSAPFLDSSYKPELFYYRPDIISQTPDWLDLGFQTGFQHESNGRNLAASRSLNRLYFKPIAHFEKPLGTSNSLEVVIGPRAWVYVGDLSDNPDIARYRGYCDLRTTVGMPDIFQLGSTLRVGDRFDRASLLLDLAIPLYGRKVPLTPYLYFQYFVGYGESLLFYKERETFFRVGFALFP